MKTLRKIFTNFALILAVLLLTVNSCRKDVDEEKPRTAAATASIGEPVDYEEEDLQAFLADVAYYYEQEESDVWMAATEAIQKMQSSTNYVYSDIDTAFAEEHTVEPYTFALTPDLDGQYNMSEIAIVMHDIAEYIREQLEVSQGEGYVPRMVTCSIDPGLTADDFVATIYIGKAYVTPPSYSDEPEATLVSDGAHPWALDADGISIPACGSNTLGVANIIMTQGGGDLLQFRNYNFHNMSYTYQGQPATPYLDQAQYIKNANSGNTFWHNTPQLTHAEAVSLAGTPPTSPLGYDASNNPVYPYTSAIFAADKGFTTPYQSYVRLGVIFAYYWTYVDTYYNFCMPQDWINYYITKVPVVFAAMRPSATCYPLTDQTIHGSHTVQDFRVWDPIAGTYSPTANTSANTNENRSAVYHAYNFKYVQLKWRINN